MIGGDDAGLVRRAPILTPHYRAEPWLQWIGRIAEEWFDAALWAAAADDPRALQMYVFTVTAYALMTMVALGAAVCAVVCLATGARQCALARERRRLRAEIIRARREFATARAVARAVAGAPPLYCDALSRAVVAAAYARAEETRAGAAAAERALSAVDAQCAFAE